MSNKTIYIGVDEEITSVIDKLVKTKVKEVFLVIPENSVLAQSFVNLKLLKREANNLFKKVTIITRDQAIQRMAKKVDFDVSENLDFTESPDEFSKEPDEIEEKSAKVELSASLKDNDDQVFEGQITEDEFKNFLETERRSSPLKMADIIKGDIVSSGTIKKEAPEPNSENSKINIPPVSPKPSLGGLEAPARQVVKNGSEDISDTLSIDEQVIHKNLYFKPEKKEKSIWPPEPYSEKIFKESNHLNPARNSASGRMDLKQKKRAPIFFKLFISLVILAVLIAGSVFYLILPKAEIVILARRENTQVDFKVFVDKNSPTDLEQNKIAGQIIKSEAKETIESPTSGERQLNERAKGVITVYNIYSSSPQSLVATTRFLSPDGKIFRLVRDVTIPGAKIEEGRIMASSIDVNVEADQPGISFNILPTDFTIPGFKGSPKYNGFYGKSKDAFSGGSTDMVRVLTQEDLNNAKNKAWEALEKRIAQQLSSQVPKNFKMLDSAYKSQIIEIKPSVEVGMRADKFTLNMKALAKTLIFSEEDIYEFLTNKLTSELADEKELSRPILIDYLDVKADLDKGTMSFKIFGSPEVVWKINEQEIKNLVAGKNEEEVRRILERPEIKEATVSVSRSLFKKIPKQADKIIITID